MAFDGRYMLSTRLAICRQPKSAPSLILFSRTSYRPIVWLTTRPPTGREGQAIVAVSPGHDF
jgi:hypothetical protein